MVDHSTVSLQLRALKSFENLIEKGSVTAPVSLKVRSCKPFLLQWFLNLSTVVIAKLLSGGNMDLVHK